MTKVFCIGFNRCGTVSLYNLFSSSSKQRKCIHNHYWWHMDTSELNMDFYSDGYEYIGGNRIFPDIKKIETTFKDCKFIIQTRPLRGWLLSRLIHNSHLYRTTNSLQSYDEMLLTWVTDRNYWYSFLSNYFINKNNYIFLDITSKNVEDKLSLFLDETFTHTFTKNNSNFKEYICNTLTHEQYVDIADSFLERFVDRDDHYNIGVCKLCDKFT